VEQEVYDDIDLEPSTLLLSITSNDPAGTPPDAVSGAAFGTNDRIFSLKAARNSDGTDRTYTVTYRSTDAAGNQANSSTTIVATDTPMYLDDFEDGEASDWTTDGGTWSVSQGDLVGHGNNATALAPFAGCSLCQVEGYLQSAGGQYGTVALEGWYQDAQNFVELVLKEDIDKWQLKHKSAGSVVAVQSVNYVLQQGVSYKARVKFTGDSFEVYVNDAYLFTVATTAPASGKVGFNVNSTTGTFREIKLRY
jgi:hypothetical protein